MGGVVLAEHRSLGHVVVIKLVKGNIKLGEQMLERVRVEAQAGARIRHANERRALRMSAVRLEV